MLSLLTQIGHCSDKDTIALTDADDDCTAKFLLGDGAETATPRDLLALEAAVDDCTGLATDTDSLSDDAETATYLCCACLFDHLNAMRCVKCERVHVQKYEHVGARVAYFWNPTVLSSL